LGFLRFVNSFFREGFFSGQFQGNLAMHRVQSFSLFFFGLLLGINLHFSSAAGSSLDFHLVLLDVENNLFTRYRIVSFPDLRISC